MRSAGDWCREAMDLYISLPDDDATSLDKLVTEVITAAQAEARREALDELIGQVRCCADGTHHVCNCSCARLRALAAKDKR